ncbi:MAG TPA: hypothetical protein VEK57_23840 [Thermoanaerobaculia bacterium]|nr:hypothetical protein [Thermoanaerobaculia bacterium]
MSNRRVLHAAALAFLLSRGLFFLLVIVGSQISFIGKVYGGSVWETRIDLQHERVIPELVRVAMVGDAWWYRSIANDGYVSRADAAGVPNYAFFPLYPLLVRATGSSEFAISGMILSNLAFACALVLLGHVALRSGLDEDDAERAIFLLAFFPTSYFCSLPLPESLFLALSLGSVLAALRMRWGVAGLLGGLAALTRVPGILLLLPLALIYLHSGERSRAKALWLFLVPLGTAAFMTYLYVHTGNALAFVAIQQNWSRKAGAFWTPLVNYLARPDVAGEPWNLIGLNFAFAVLLLAAACGLLWQRRWDLGAYALASVLLPLSTGSLQSLGRYAVVVFPVYLWLALAGRRPLYDRLLLAAHVTIFGWLTAMLILRVDFALA